MLLWILAGLTLETNAAESLFAPDRILIKPHPAGLRDDLHRFHDREGARVVHELKNIDGIQILSLPPGRDVATVVQRYRNSGLVEFAEPDYRLQLAASPNDPAYATGVLWHLHNYGQSGGKVDADIDAPEAWDYLRYASNVLVATIDSGARVTHEDLAANVWTNPGEIPGNGLDDDNDGYVDDVHGVNVVSGTGQPLDLIGHGTEVAGLIGSVGDNGKGSSGVAWRVQILPCRFTDDAGNVFVSNAAKALDFARAKGAQIINASFIITIYSSTLYAAINNCRSAGIIVTAAAGNASVNNDATPYYPASFDLDNVVAVAATTRNDLLASFSNYGATSVDLGAPGQDVYSTFNSADNSYLVNSGTSFASPLVAGALALLRAQYPSAPHRQLIDQLLRTTDPLPALSGKCVSGGRLNVARALDPAVVARFNAGAAVGLAPFLVRFTNTSFGIPIGAQWDFGDGATSNALNPVHTYAAPGEYQVSLTVTGRVGNVSATNRVVTALRGYQLTNEPFAWVDAASMASLGLTGDGVSSAQGIPFPFQFYSQSYTAIFVGANGVLSFENQALPGLNTELPSVPAPNNLICPFWDNLEPAAGSVRFGTTGTAPNRKAVISWLAVDGTGNPSAAFTFQAILEESSSDIVFQYLEVEPESRNPGAAGKSATIGIEHRSGLVASKYSYNGANLVTNGQALRFVAPHDGGSGTNTPPPWPVTIFNPSRIDGGFSYSFTSQLGRLYSPQVSDALGASNWQTLGTLTGNGSVLTVTHTNSSALPQFHRIEAR